MFFFFFWSVNVRQLGVFSLKRIIQCSTLKKEKTSKLPYSTILHNYILLNCCIGHWLCGLWVTSLFPLSAVENQSPSSEMLQCVHTIVKFLLMVIFRGFIIHVWKVWCYFHIVKVIFGVIIFIKNINRGRRQMICPLTALTMKNTFYSFMLNNNHCLNETLGQSLLFNPSPICIHVQTLYICVAE